MATDNHLLRSCRYYRGEAVNPYEGKDDNKATMWMLERMWVDRASRGLSPVDSDVLNDYETFGLKSFNADDGVPISLKAFLFARFMHWQGGNGMEADREGFKQFYLRFYLTED